MLFFIYLFIFFFFLALILSRYAKTPPLNEGQGDMKGHSDFYQGSMNIEKDGKEVIATGGQQPG